MEGLPTEHLFCPLEFAWPGTDADALEQRDIKLRIDATVVVASCYGDTALVLQHSKVMCRDAKAFGRAGYMYVTNHLA